MLGQNIREIRNLRNMSQKDLAQELNTSYKTISSWEVGNSNPNPDNLRELSRVLRVPTDYLLGAGVFENWSKLQDNRARILKDISRTMRNMSYDILECVDNISFIRLVYAFNVTITDDDGISVDSILPSYSESLFNPRMQADEDWLSLIHSLGPDEQRQLRGYVDCLVQSGATVKQAK